MSGPQPIPDLTDDQAHELLGALPSMTGDRRNKAQAYLGRYRDAKLAAGAVPFPKMVEQRRERDKALESRFLESRQAYADNLPPKARAVWDRLGEPGMVRSDNQAFLKDIAGTSRGYFGNVQRIGREVLGLSGEFGENEFHAAAKSHLSKRRDRRGMVEEIPAVATMAAIEGSDALLSYNDWLKKAQTREGYDQKEAGQLFDLYHSSYKEVAGKIDRDLVAKVTQGLDRWYSQTEDGEGLDPELAAEVVTLAGVGKENMPVVLAAMAAWARKQETTSGTESKTVLLQLGESLRRGATAIIKDASLSQMRAETAASEAVDKGLSKLPKEMALPAAVAKSVGEKLLGMGVAPKSSEQRRREVEVLDLSQMIRAVAEGTIDPIRDILPDGALNLLERGAYGFAASVPYTAAAMIPGAGFPAVVGSLGERNYRELRMANPEAPKDKLFGVAYASAVPEALIERFQAKWVMGKMPNFMQAATRQRGFLNQRVRRLIGAEFATEGIQDFTLPLVQNIASQIDDEIPGVNLKDELGEWAAQRPEVLVSVIPLALIGSGVAGGRDIKGIGWELSNVNALKAAGFSDQQARDIVAKGNTADRLKAVRDTYDKREGTEESRAEGAAALAESTETARKGESLGYFPPIIREENGYGVVLKGGETISTPTYAEADYIRQQMVEDSEVAQDQSVLDIARYFEEIARVGEKTELSEDFRTLEEDVAEGVVDEGTAYERLRIFDQATGTKYNGDLSGVLVLGRNESEFRDGVFTSASKLYRGASVLDVVEEKAEGDAKRWEAEKLVSIDQLGAMIRQWERVSGDQILTGETRQDVIEGWSNLVKAYAVSRFKGDKEPAGFRGALKRLLRGYRTFFEQVFRRAAKINKARRDGTLDGDLEMLLADSIGVSPDTQIDISTRDAAEEMYGGDITHGGEVSYSLAPAKDYIDRLGKVLDQKLRDPERRREMYVEAKARVKSLLESWGKLAEQIKNKEADARDSLTKAIGTLNAISAAFPPEVRAKVGGYTTLSRKRTARGQATEIEKRIHKLDEVLETWLRKEYADDIRKTLEKVGRKQKENRTWKGGLGQEGHELHDLATAAIDMTPTQADEWLEAMAGKIEAEGDTSKAETLYQKYEVVDVVGALEDRTAEQLDYALRYIENLFGEFSKKRKAFLAARNEDYAAKRAAVQNAIGGEGSREEANRGRQRGRVQEFLKDIATSAYDARQFWKTTFAGSKVADDHMRRANIAVEAYEREVVAKQKRLTDAIREATGKDSDRAALNWLAEQKAEKIEKTGIHLYKSGRRKEKIPLDHAEEMMGVPLSAKAESLGYNMAEVKLIRRAYAEFQKKSARSKARTKYLEVDFNTARKTEEVARTKVEALNEWLFLEQPGYAENQAARGYPPEAKAQIEAFIGPELLTIGRKMRDELKAMQPRISKVHDRLNGVGIPSLTNYWPGTMDVNRAGESMMVDPFGAEIQLQSRNPGALKGRVQNNTEPRVVDAVDVYMGHVKQMEYYIHLAELGHELRSIYGDKGTTDAVAREHGADTEKRLKLWLDMIDAGGSIAKEADVAHSRVFRFLYSQFVKTALAWKVTSHLIQGSNTLALLQEVSTGSYIRGASKVATNPLDLARALKTIWQDEYIQLRLESGGTPEMRAALAMRPRTTNGAQAFVTKGIESLNTADAAALSLGGAITYEAKRAELLKAGMSEEVAAATALEATRDILRKVSQPTNFLNKSAAENNAGSVAKMILLSFISDPRRKVSNLITALQMGEKRKFAKLALLLFGVLPALEFLLRGVGRTLFNGEEPEDAFSPEELRVQMVLGPIGGIPVYGKLIEGIVRWQLNSRVYSNDPFYRIYLSLGPRLFRDAGSALENLSTGDLDDAFEDMARVSKDLGAVSGTLGGIGNVVSQGTDFIRFIFGDGEDEERD